MSHFWSLELLGRQFGPTVRTWTTVVSVEVDRVSTPVSQYFQCQNWKRKTEKEHTSPKRRTYLLWQVTNIKLLRVQIKEEYDSKVNIMDTQNRPKPPQTSRRRQTNKDTIGEVDNDGENPGQTKVVPTSSVRSRRMCHFVPLKFHTRGFELYKNHLSVWLLNVTITGGKIKKSSGSCTWQMQW